MHVGVDKGENWPFLLNFMHLDVANRDFMHQARYGSGRGEGQDHGGEVSVCHEGLPPESAWT
jgi:hypothetical protein